LLLFLLLLFCDFVTKQHNLVLAKGTDAVQSGDRELNMVNHGPCRKWWQSVAKCPDTGISLWSQPCYQPQDHLYVFVVYSCSYGLL